MTGPEQEVEASRMTEGKRVPALKKEEQIL